MDTLALLARSRIFALASLPLFDSKNQKLIINARLINTLYTTQMLALNFLLGSIQTALLISNILLIS